MEQRSAWPPSLSEILDRHHTALAKELVWAIGSHPLLRNDVPKEFKPWDGPGRSALLFDLLDAADDATFTVALEEKWNQWGAPSRLGQRFEHLVRHWFDRHPDWTVHAANEVINSESRTMGELDLLLEHEGKWTHIELAFKFYLGRVQSGEWSEWIGIDPRDRLDRKMSKFARQLTLTNTALGSEWVESKGWQVHDHGMWMKGWFFVHFKSLSRPKLPKHASPESQFGWWCHRADWPSVWNESGTWIALEPHHWLRVRHDARDVHVLTRAAEAFEWVPERRATMVCQAAWSGTDWIELSRGVVVPDSWPEFT